MTEASAVINLIEEIKELSLLKDVSIELSL